MTQVEWPARIWARLRPRIKSFFYGIGVWGICGIAIRYRPALSEITIVGITGSAGKTTAKKYVTAILSKLEPTKGNFGTQNSPVETSLFLLKQRRKYKCLVQELGIGDAPGDIPRAVKILRPSIGAVTNIGHDHYRLFRSLEAIAEEKASLVRCLPRDGVAVLNIDDPLVRPMAALSPAKVIFFGASEEADIRMSDITGTWPEHFGMTVSYQSHSVRVTTKLVGRQWAPTILAAIGIGLARGLTLDDCAAAIAEVEPEFNRLTEKTVPDGAHFLLDAFNPDYSRRA